MDVDNPPILYVLMRNDLPDYQPGKSMAQANHAGTMFMRDMARLDPVKHNSILCHYHDWLSEADGFGTCIVLSVDSRQLDSIINCVMAMGLQKGIVLDPTYPIRDGHEVKTLPVKTCGYIFGLRERCRIALYPLNLF